MILEHPEQYSTKVANTIKKSMQKEIVIIAKKNSTISSDPILVRDTKIRIVSKQACADVLSIGNVAFKKGLMNKTFVVDVYANMDATEAVSTTIDLTKYGCYNYVDFSHKNGYFVGLLKKRNEYFFAVFHKVVLVRLYCLGKGFCRLLDLQGSNAVIVERDDHGPAWDTLTQVHMTNISSVSVQKDNYYVTVCSFAITNFVAPTCDGIVHVEDDIIFFKRYYEQVAKSVQVSEFEYVVVDKNVIVFVCDNRTVIYDRQTSTVVTKLSFGAKAVLIEPVTVPVSIPAESIKQTNPLIDEIVAAVKKPKDLKPQVDELIKQIGPALTKHKQITLNVSDYGVDVLLALKKEFDMYSDVFTTTLGTEHFVNTVRQGKFAMNIE